jgi:hypothetical protein
MKFLKIYNENNTLSDWQAIVDNEIFFKFRIYDYYINPENNEVYRNVKRKQYKYNTFTNTVEEEIIFDRVYLKRMISDYYYGEFTGYNSFFKITFKNKNPLDLRITNFTFQDLRSYNKLFWYPERSHLNPNICV